MASMNILLRYISPTNTTESIHVKFIQILYHVDTNYSEPDSLQYIFHDEEGTFISMHIPNECVRKYAKKFKEGRVYRIKKFVVTTNVHKHKTTNHKYMLNLSLRTLVRELDGANFPTFTYPLSESQSTSMNSTNENTLQDLSNALMHVVSIKDIYVKKKK